MLQNVSNCHKSERSRNKNNVVLVIIWGLPGLAWRWEIEVFIFHVCWMFRINYYKGRKQFHTAPHLRFDKFHQNKRIALKLQRCVLESFAYLCSFSRIPDPILSRRKSLLNTKLAFPGIIWSAHMNLCEPRFDDKNCPQQGRGWMRLSTSKRRHCGVTYLSPIFGITLWHNGIKGKAKIMIRLKLIY